MAAIHISTSIQQALDQVFGYVPNIIGFLVILLIGYVVARIVKTVINKALGKLKVDDHLANSSAGGVVDRVSPGGRPSRLIGAVVFWLIFLYFLTAAVGALDIPSVTAFMNQVLAYLPNVIAAVLIFVIAAAISAGAAAAAKRTIGDTPTGKMAEAIIPGLIMSIAIFMVLEQLKIATSIVVITYGALVGMLALTGALAFGLGGREVAGQLWAQAYESSQDAKEQAKEDLSKGRDRAKAEIDAAKSSSGSGSGRGARSSSRTRSGRQPVRASSNGSDED